MPDPFGSFNWLCSHTPLPQCNLFFSQLYNDPTPDLTILFPSNSTFFEEYHVTLSDFADDPNVMAARSDAGVGIGSNCQIPKAGQKGSLGDIALIILSALSMVLIGYLLVRGNLRKAAVGRVELRTLFAAYILNMAFQIITMTSLLEQGTLVLSILSSIHLGVYVLLFWLLLVTAIVSTQWIDDGSPQSLVSSTIIGILLFSATLYISLDTSQQWTDTFTLGDELGAKTLFVLTLIWPAFAWIAFVITMISVSIIKLNEVKPALMQFVAALLFAGSQIVFFLASEPLCNASKGKINSSFLATLLQTASMVVIYFAWESITEADFPDEHGQTPYGQPQFGNTYGQPQYGNSNGYQYGHDNDGYA